MNPLAALHDRGAHLVCVNDDKRPTARAWQKLPPRFAAVEAHVAAGGLVGVIPASLNCFVVDIDEGGDAGVEALRGVLGEPITVTETRRNGGFHAWYRAPVGEVRNRRWQLGAGAGEIRGSNGFVVLWDPAEVAEGLEHYFDGAQPADAGRLPRPATDGKRGPEAVRAAKPGERNNVLNREVFKAARRGADIDLYRDAALANGMPPVEVEATIASAARAGAAQAPNIVPAPSRPMTVARELVATSFTDGGIRTLRNHRDDFYCWSGRHWSVMGVLDVRSIAYKWLEDAYFDHPEKDELQRFDPTRRKIDDVIDALRGGRAARQRHRRALLDRRNGRPARQ